jgi:S-DNA-T family DNA segregation ATPase FtsK/SpoIIIE
MFKNFYIKTRLRKQITEAFLHAELYHTFTYDNKKRYVYPKIHNINWNKERVRYVFTLPNGVDPKKVTEHEWVFKQSFGEFIELSGKYKKFVLKAYYDGLPDMVDYDYEEFYPHIKEMVLPIILGKDLNGLIKSYDMNEYPHLLLTGETGSGKSSLLRAISTTLIQFKKPDELRFLFGDLKRAEFGIYRNVKHVDQVCIDEKTLLPALQKVKGEMDRRGNLLDQYDEINHIKDLPEKLPYIFVVIDEVAMLKKNKKIMGIIEEISAVGRSLGIQLLLSMQRADHKLMDGALKNNLTVRISGRQSNESNSRIAGVPHAHDIDIKEKGRMIIMLDKPMQFKAPLLELSDVTDILEPYKDKKNPDKPDNVKEFKFGVLDNETKR